MADIFNPKTQIDYDTEKVQSSVPSPFSSVINKVKAEENERFLNRQKYGIELPDEQYKILNEVIANSENPEEESYKTACAVKWAKESKMPFSECYANIDDYISELWDKEKTSSYKNAFVAISDMFQIGRNNLQIGHLGRKILEAEIKNDNPAMLEAYYKELEALENDNAARADNVPRKWWTEALKAGAESLPYTGAVAGAAMIGSFVPGGQVVGGFLASQYLTRGQAYLDLRKKGIEPDIARQASIVSGALQAAVEATLGEAMEIAGAGVSAVTKKGSKAVSNAVSEKIVNALQKKFVLGTGQKLAVKLATSYVVNIAEEGAEEALQTTLERNVEDAAAEEQNNRNAQKRNKLLQQAADELGENFRESYEEELLKEYPKLEYNKAGEIAKEAAESFKGGVMGALALGIVPSSINTTVTAVNYNVVKEAAESIPSVETFKKIVNENDGAKKVFEQFGNEQEQNDAIRQVWENAQSTRDKRDAEIIAGTKETTAFNENMEEAPAENDEGETEVIPAARDENGRLYTENELKETEEGEKQKGVFKIGNAEASDKNLYGYINYTLDEESEIKTVTINDFKMTAYRRGLTQEAYDEFAQKMAEEYPDYKIEWNPTSRAGKELKELLISKNLSGKNNGLNYYTTERLADIETRKEVSKQIAQYMPNLNGDQRAAAVALLEAGARRQGYSLTDYVQNTFGGKIFGELSELDSKNVTAAQRQEMKGAQGWRRYGNQIKAVIYAGEKADFSTFAHEIAHVWQSQLTGDLKEQAEKAFSVKNGDWDKSTFTFADGHTESSGEAFARGFEQFLETGKAPNAEMKTLFQKFAEFLQDVYKTLKQFINMSPEIESVYNQLMDADDSVLKLAEKAVNQADRELFAKLQEEKRAKAEAEKAAAEEQKQAEEQAKQDTKDEESEITLDDETIAEPDFSPIEETEESEEEAEPETDNEVAQESGSASDENGEIPEDMFFQKVTENLKNNGVENAEEITEVIQDKAATITEKVRKSSDAAREALRFQIIGEKGAAALDKAEEATTRLDNLKIAREMTEAGKDAKTIRLATGWEKGTDGLWRYEIADDYHLKNIKATNAKLEKYEKKLKEAKKEYDYLTGLTEEEKQKKRRMIADMVKHNALEEGTTLESMIEEAEQKVHMAEMLLEYDTFLDVEKALKRLIERGVNPKDFWDDMGESFYLSNLIDNDELFKAYPQLEKVTIDFARYDVDGHQGSYDANEKSIRIFPAGMRSYGQFRSTLAHEVQHAIQRIEGFAVGGSQAQFKEMEAPSKVQEHIMLLDDIPMNELMNYKQHEEFKFLKENLPEVLEENIDGLGTLEQIMDRWLEDVKNGIHTIKNVYDEIQNARKAYNKYNRLNEYANEKSAFEKYESLAGEVEARNVQSRIHMTPEERLNTLLSETADVAPEEQIVLRDGLGISESNEIEEKKLTRKQIIKEFNRQKNDFDEKDFMVIGTGVEGTEYVQGENNPVRAAKFLLAKKTGFVKNAFKNTPYGNVGLIYGDQENKGINHIVYKHIAFLNDFESIEEAVNTIDDILRTGTEQPQKGSQVNNITKVIEKNNNRVILGINENGNRIVTSYDFSRNEKKKERKSSDITLIDRNAFMKDGTLVPSEDFLKYNANNISLSNIRFQKVYHGSGADFDKFNTEQYGLTGEGSMSFGYGTYVTDSEEIARDYANRQGLNLDNVKITEETRDYYDIAFNISRGFTFEEAKEKELQSNEKYIQQVTESIEKVKKSKLDESEKKARIELKENHIKEAIEHGKKLKELYKNLTVEEVYQKLGINTKRNLYTVEIPDDGYLGWFETVSKSNRSKIAEALFNKIIELDDEGMYKGAEKELKAELNSAFESDTDGSHLYGTLIDYLGSDKEASRFLHSIGFAGIKYPAGTNYGNGNGAYNYVIFDDEQAKIIDHLRFQTEEQLYNDARSFDNWQEFMEYEQGTADWSEDDVSPIPAGADAVWYKTTWELAQGINKANEVQKEKTEDSTHEHVRDALFLVKMEEPGVLENFLQEVDYINKFDFEKAGAPDDADEAAEFAKIQRLKDFIHTKLRHGSWISNATRVAGGKELTPSTRKRLMNLITLAAREYRDIYTEITGNQEFAVAPEESYFSRNIEPYAKKLNKLLTPEEALTMSPEQLRQLADSLSDELSNKEIAAKIKNGTLKMDDELKNYITKLDRRVKLAEERYSKLEKETEADYRRITDYAQRRILDTYDELLKARAKLNNKKNLLNKKIGNGLKITEKYGREVQQAQTTYDDIFKVWNNLVAVNKISAEVQEAMKRKEEYIATVEEQAKLKNDKAILTQISDMRKKLVKNAMRRVPFERINYEHAKKIIAIQRIFYPNLTGSVNKWIGEKPIYVKGIVAEYLTNAEKKAEIDKMLNRKANRAGETGTRNRIEYLQDLLRKTKSSDDVDNWTTRDKNLLLRYIPQSDWVKDLNLEALEKERADSIQLDIDEEGFTESKIVKNDKGKEQVLIIHRPKFSEEIGQMVKDALGADLFNILINKPFEDWTTAEMEKFTIRINDIYTEGRDELEAKRQAQRDEAKEIRDAIRNAVRDTGIEFKDTDTPEERKEKQKKLDKILGTSTIKGTLSSKKEKQLSKLEKILHGYYDANVRRVARILDGYNDGINVNELYFKEAECYNAKERMLRKRNEKIAAVLKENNIKLEDLYQTMEIDGTVYSYDELLYILAADKDYESKDVDIKVEKALQTDPYADNDDYAPTARNAVMFGNMGSADTDVELKESLAEEDRQTKERIANNEFTDEEKKAIEEGFELITTPGTKKYITACHMKYAAVIQAAKAMLEENPQFEKLMEAIDADYTEQFERLQQISIEEFNAPVNRVKKYVPLNRMESNGDTNENRVREDLLATSGAGTGRQYVDKGMTQKRINISPLNQKPVELGLYKTWADATERTEHFINYAAYVRELNRVYKSRESTYLRSFIEKRYGKAAVNYIDEYIAEVANPNANSATGALDTIVRTLRGKTAPAYLSWKASSIIKQAATSPMPYMQFVSPAEYLKASFDIIKSKCKIYDDIKEKSIFMNNRVMDPLIDLIKEQTENATNPVTSKLNKFSAIGMQGLEWIDWACVAPGWLACYRKKYAELEKANDIELIEAQIREENEMLDPSNPDRMTNDQIKAAAEERAKSKDEIENEAVQWADDCTRLCQPSNRKVDLAPLFKESGKGSEIGKAFLQFQTSLNVIWQNLRYDIPYAIRQKQFKQVAGMILGYTIAGILVNAITEGIKPKDDDEDKELSVLRKFLYYSTTQFTDAIPVIGSIVSNLNNKIITGDKGLTSSSNDLIPMFTKAATGTQSAIKGNWEKAAKNYAEAAGLATGLPVSGTKEALRVFGIGDGEEGAEFKPGSLLGRRE